MDAKARLRELAFEAAPLAQLVVDANGVPVMVNERMRVLFGLAGDALGRPLQELERICPSLELRSLIEQSCGRKAVVTQASIECRPPAGAAQCLDVVVTPLHAESPAPLGVAIAFLHATRYVGLSEQLYAANEELRSANEELHSTNEELRSINEELRNDELRARTEELERVDAFLESVLAGLGAAALAVDDQLRVSVWNVRSRDLWGLRDEEVRGKPLLELRMGLPVDELRALIGPVLSGDVARREAVLDAVNRHGETVRCRVSCSPLVATPGRRGAILIMHEAY
jgi:two-component system CheB/CheR fusion protein